MTRQPVTPDQEEDRQARQKALNHLQELARLRQVAFMRSFKTKDFRWVFRGFQEDPRKARKASSGAPVAHTPGRSAWRRSRR